MIYRVIFLILLSAVIGLAQPAHQEARRFVCEAVSVKLEDTELSQPTIDLLLATDETGLPLSFIPDCPICLGVQDALQSLMPANEDDETVASFSADKASTRTSALAKFVRSAVSEHLLTIESPTERIEMNLKLQAGSEEGQRQLARQQSRRAEPYKMMWSCLMCDAAAKASED